MGNNLVVTEKSNWLLLTPRVAQKIYLWHQVQRFCLKKTHLSLLEEDTRESNDESQGIWFLRTVGIRISRCKVPSQTLRKKCPNTLTCKDNYTLAVCWLLSPALGWVDALWYPAMQRRAPCWLTEQVKSLLWSAPQLHFFKVILPLTFLTLSITNLFSRQLFPMSAPRPCHCLSSNDAEHHFWFSMLNESLLWRRKGH